MDKHMKNYLKLSIFLLIMSALLLSLPTLIYPDCTTVVGVGCRSSISQNMISLLLYIWGIVFGISGAIFLRKHNDLMDENKRKIKIDKELIINEKRNEIEKIINDKIDYF